MVSQEKSNSAGPVPYERTKFGGGNVGKIFTRSTRDSRSGFTLVELLVVISIISLLASTVLASLNSARVKADNTARNQTAEEYIKALEFLYDANLRYPGGVTTAWSCLGNYPDLASYSSANVCWYNTISENPAVLTSLIQFLPSLPLLKPVDSSFGTYKTPLYKCTVVNCSQAEVIWVLSQPDQNCSYGARPTTITDVTWCDLYLGVITS